MSWFHHVVLFEVDVSYNCVIGSNLHIRTPNHIGTRLALQMGSHYIVNICSEFAYVAQYAKLWIGARSSYFHSLAMMMCLIQGFRRHEDSRILPIHSKKLTRNAQARHQIC